MSRMAEDIHSMAKESFKDHQIYTDLTLTRHREITIRHPEHTMYGFTFFELPGNILFTGDLGTIVIRGYNLDWLLSNQGNYGYVAEKVVASSSDLREYSKDVAMDSLEDIPEHYGEDEWTDDMDEELTDLLNTLAADSWEGDRLHEVRKAFYNSSFFDGDMPTFTDWSPHFCWFIEAVKLTKGLLQTQREEEEVVYG